MERTEAQKWWHSLSDTEKWLFVKEHHGFDVNIDEIKKNVSDKDINLFYEYRNLLKVKNV